MNARHSRGWIGNGLNGSGFDYPISVFPIPCFLSKHGRHRRFPLYPRSEPKSGYRLRSHSILPGSASRKH